MEDFIFWVGVGVAVSAAGAIGWIAYHHPGWPFVKFSIAVLLLAMAAVFLGIAYNDGLRRGFDAATPFIDDSRLRDAQGAVDVIRMPSWVIFIPLAIAAVMYLLMHLPYLLDPRPFEEEGNGKDN